MNILAIDTSNETMGIAIYKQDKLKVEYISNSKNKHSVRLMPAIHRLMEDAELLPKDLSKIVVAKGPGSYTGVRIGVSTAKTMAWSLNIPVIGISSLEALALQGVSFNHLICPFFDARRGLVFTGLYQSNAGGKLELVKEEQNILIEDWLKQLKEMNEQIIFLSPDIEMHKELIKELLGELAILPTESFHIARPSLLAMAGKERQAANIHTLTPNYLRLVEAEAKWLEAQRKESHE